MVWATLFMVFQRLQAGGGYVLALLLSHLRSYLQRQATSARASCSRRSSKLAFEALMQQGNKASL